MASPFHPGELDVQARAGVRAAAARVGGIVQSAIPPQLHAFLAAERLAIVGSRDATGAMWASLLTGDAGMLRVPDPHTLRIAARPVSGDPLARALDDARASGAPALAGVLLIDLARRRRLRVNGDAESDDDGVVVRVRQVYGNCPKYIQRRVLDVADTPSAPAHGGAPLRGERLSDAQRAWIARADTFFIASVHPVAGADASHRGGEPGFVQTTRADTGEDVLVFPDYSGNDMFNTFGNLAVEPAAGLLFVDFERGATLQLSGSAEVLWAREEFAAMPGAQRAVRFVMRAAVEQPHATPLRWRLVERSPFNPPPRARA